MAHGAYLHPLRTIEMAWEWDDDGIPVLTGYRDQPPSDPVEAGDMTIIHSDAILSHRYPDEARSPIRAQEEREAFLPEADPTSHDVVPIHARGFQFDRPWTTLLAYASRTAFQVCDIQADLAAMKLDGPTLLLGRRGGTWWIGAQGDELVALDRQPHPENTSLSVFLHEVLDELLSTDNLPSRTLTLFGDQISLDILKDLTNFFRGRIDGVERFNPFHHMRADLEEAAANAVLKRAHLLGCFVGAIHLHGHPAPADVAEA